MTQFASQLESDTFSLSSLSASFFKDLQDALGEFMLDFKDVFERECDITRESIRSAVRGTSFKVDKVTENDARLDYGVEELENSAFLQEVPVIPQNEVNSGLEEENLQVSSKMFFIKDTSSNIEWEPEDVWDQMERFLQEMASEKLRRCKDLVFLFQELKCHQPSRGVTLFEVNIDGICYRLIIVSQVKDLFILKMGLFQSPYVVPASNWRMTFDNGG